MPYNIYTPNVHLYAFHLYQNFNQNYADNNANTQNYENNNNDKIIKSYDNNLLWNKFRKISKYLQITTPLTLTEFNPEVERKNLLESATDNNTILNLEGNIHHPEGETKIKGSVCPLQLYDSYILWLKLYIPKLNENHEKTELVNTLLFKYFNESECLSYQNINSSIGQTVLLTAELTPEDAEKKEEWQQIATECASYFLGVNNNPKLYQTGELFGSPIFEYGNPSQANENHIFVWLFLPESNTEDKFNNCNQEFIDLFFYRQKTIKAYHGSREVYKNISEGYQKIQNIINAIEPNLTDEQIDTYPTQPLSKDNLNNFTHHLRTLPKLDFQYLDWLGELENYGITLNINTKNYGVKLNQIKEKVDIQDIQFLAKFNEEISNKFAEQVKIDLNYFQIRKNLIDKLISSIRGMLDIEQVYLKKQWLKNNKQQNQQLKTTIAIVGTGIGVAGVSANTFQYLQKPPEKTPGMRILSGNFGTHPFTYSLIVSLGMGVVAAFIVTVLIYLWRQIMSDKQEKY